MCAHVCFYSIACVCGSAARLRVSSGGEWQRTGVIGSSLSPQTGGTFHHRGISFQFSKPRNTSDTINKLFFSNTGRKNASQQLFNHPFDCLAEREHAPLCSQREKDKVRMYEEKKSGTTKQSYLDRTGTIQYRTLN